MSKHKLIQKVVGIAAAAAVLGSLFVPMAAQAAQITSRKVTLGSSAGGATTTYTVDTAALPTGGTPVQAVRLQACTTASGSCTSATGSGFSASGQGLASQPTGLGAASGWTTNATAGSLEVKNLSNVTNPSGAVNIPFTGVTNITPVNTTFFLRMTTYSDNFTTPIDSGVIAVSTSQTITVTASVDEALTFCTGTSGIYGVSCAGATGTTVNLGPITPTSTGFGTSEMGITTNAQSGYAITYYGATLTSGANTIDANPTPTASIQGTEQFGINLVANTVPTVGSNGTGTGWTLGSDYATTNLYTFIPSTTTSVVTNPGSQAFASWKVSHVANVASTTQPGTYSTDINYVATPTF